MAAKYWKATETTSAEPEGDSASFINLRSSWGWLGEETDPQAFIISSHLMQDSKELAELSLQWPLTRSNTF